MESTAASRKPHQEKKSRPRRARRENRSLSAWCFKKKSRSRYDFTSGVPMFANGAISGAFVAAFGNMRSDGTVSGSVSGGSGSGKVQELQVTFDTSQGYATEAEAAQAALETANRVSDYSNGSTGDFEVVGFVGKGADGLYYPSVGWVTDSTFRFQPVFVDSAIKPVAIYHTHPNHGPNPLSFSKIDIRFAEQTKANSYLGPPNGDFRVYRPGTMNPLSDGTHTGISLCPGGSPGCLPTHSGWR